jgi:hypothetical protein
MVRVMPGSNCRGALLGVKREGGINGGGMTGGACMAEREGRGWLGQAGSGWSGPAGFPGAAQVGSWLLPFILFSAFFFFYF